MTTAHIPQAKLDAIVAALRDFPAGGIHSLSGFMTILTVCHGPRHMKDVAERVGSHSASLTGVVDGLARAGYVSRSVDLRDRRVILIEATEKGLALAARLISENETHQDKHHEQSNSVLHG